MAEGTVDEITIREARPEDAEAILAYLRRVGGETDNLSFGPEGVAFTVEEETAYLARIQRQEKSCHLCAWHGEELVGEAGFEGSAQPRVSHRVELGITVARAWWGRGVGTRLFGALIDRARSCGIGQPELWVRSDNERAIALYRKFGFERAGHVDNFMRIDDVPIAFDLMVRAPRDNESLLE